MCLNKFDITSYGRGVTSYLQPLNQTYVAITRYSHRIYIIAGETRCAGCLCTSSGLFKNIEPHRTYSNPYTTATARCEMVCHISSERFDCTEPSPSTSLQGKQGVHGAY